MKVKRVLLLISLLCAISIGSAVAQEDPLGKIDTVTFYHEKIDDGKWLVSAHVWNDEYLAAISISMKFTAGVSKIKVDSVSYTGTRTEYFAQKYNPVDEENQTVLIGGLAYMGADKPPMSPGEGEVARVYLSAVDPKKADVLAVDTIYKEPNGTLMLVDKDAKTIRPAFKVVNKDSKAADMKKKEDKKK